jgi:hypothetical protein
MTLDGLGQQVWDELPALYRVGGRRLCSRIVRRAVATWPSPVLEQCDAEQSAVVGKYHARSVERSVRANYQMGFLAMLIFSAMVQEIVRILVRWWLERGEHRDAMRQLSAEANA